MKYRVIYRQKSADPLIDLLKNVITDYKTVRGG